MKKITGILLAVFCILIFINKKPHSIPAFARKYQMTCKTCHSPFPKLSDYGEEFAGNGFQLPDKEAPRYYVDTGDDALSLIRDIPIAFRLEGFVTLNNLDSGQLDFGTPYFLKILSGGEIARNIGYYFYFFFSERGEIAGVEDAFMVFNNLFGADLDFYIGQFQVSDPLFKRELRLTYEDYKIYGTNVGNSIVNLKYDRGLMFTLGLETGTDIVFEVLNGTGIGEANIFKNFDNDDYKNVLGRVSQDIGKHLRIGGFGYIGKEENEGVANSLWMAGGDLTISLEPFELNFQYVERNDDNPYFSWIEHPEIATRGLFGELIFRPKGDDSDWYLVGLYNWVESDIEELKYSSMSMTFGYLLRRNLRLVAEYTFVFDEGLGGEYSRLLAGLITAF